MNAIQRATDFGTFRSRKNFFSFALKCVFYIVPAIILGNYTDVAIRKIQTNNEDVLYYILLQTFVIIATLYIFLQFLTKYTNEFQVTIAGGFFAVLYFGMQTNYIVMIQEYMGSFQR